MQLKSLESDIRTLIIKISMELDRMTLKLDDTSDHDKRWEISVRRNRLSRLSSECLTNIDKEIDFFRNN